MTNIAVIIVAGGAGTRMSASIPKQFIRIGGTEILVRTIRKFLHALDGPEIMVVLPHGEIERWGEIAARNGLGGLHKVCTGGNTRFESVRCGIEALGDCGCRWIAVHDGARPLLSEQMIRRCVRHAAKNGSAVPVTEPVDSFRIVDGSELRPLSRALLREVQTPQIFGIETLREAYKVAYSPAFTDDATVVESAGGKISFCEGERRNIKITTSDDLIFAEAVVGHGSHL